MCLRSLSTDFFLSSLDSTEFALFGISERTVVMEAVNYETTIARPNQISFTGIRLFWPGHGSELCPSQDGIFADCNSRIPSHLLCTLNINFSPSRIPADCALTTAQLNRCGSHENMGVEETETKASRSTSL